MPSYSHKKSQVNAMHKLALFIAWACVFQLIEFVFPNPFPGVRLGLANMISLVVLFQMGFIAALEVAIIRVLISSILVGTFLSPMFALSLAGAITSTLTMGILFKLSLKQEYLRFSIIGISIAGAIVHTMTQLFLVYVILIKHTGIFFLTPWLLISALIMGGITGIIARQISKDLDASATDLGRKEVGLLVGRLLAKTEKQQIKESPKASFLKQISTTLKIIYVCAIALLVVWVENVWLYVGLLLGTLALALIGHIQHQKLWSGLRKMRFFLITTFIIDIIFINQGTLIVDWGWIHITTSGVNQGVLFVLRLTVLILNSYLVSLTTSPEDLAHHLGRLLTPLKIFRFSPSRFSRVMMVAWMLIPGLLEQTFRYLRTSLTSISAIRHIAKTLSGLIILSMDPAQNETDL